MFTTVTDCECGEMFASCYGHTECATYSDACYDCVDAFDYAHCLCY